MTVIVKHNKTNTITDWTQAQLDEQIALGNFAPGTTLANIVLPSDWNNDHTLTGLGTMAEQDATAVAITGGTINNTTIGATTATTGKFTSVTTPSVTATTTDLTLSAISTGNFNVNTPNGTAFKVLPVGATSSNWLQVGNPSTTVIRLGPAGTTVADFRILAPTFTTFYTGSSADGLSDGSQQFRVSNTASAVNYVQVTGAATGARPSISSQGSDTNIGLNFDVKGGPNIFFRSYAGNSVQLKISGTNNSVNNHIISGGASTIAPTISLEGTDTNISMAFQPKGTGAIDLAAGSSGVNISNGGTVTAITRTAGGSGYATAPTVAISAPTTAGGVQATATCTVTAGAVNTTFTITNAGSGYIEQPTITFSGGGGSGATAYATVGSDPIVRAIGSVLKFFTPNGETLRLLNSGVANANYVGISGGGTGSRALVRSEGSDTNIDLSLLSTGTGNINFATNGASGNIQARVSNTASAVNYVQVTGAATTGRPIIQVAGSDTNIGITYTAKGTGIHAFGNGNGTQLVLQAGSTSSVNRIEITPTVTGSAPILSAGGTDTNIDLALTPKGTGLVRFGTYVAGALLATGYINIKAADGTTYKVLVST
jgi:hypothetical protein